MIEATDLRFLIRLFYWILIFLYRSYESNPVMGHSKNRGHEYKEAA